MKRWAALLCTLGLMVLIFVLSAQTSPQSEQLSDAVLSAAERTGVNAFIPVWFDPRAYANIRKWAHVCLYAALGVSMAATAHLWSRRALPAKMAAAAVVCLLYAAGDELHQYFVPGRAGMWQDVFIDALGFVPGIAAVCLFLRRQTKHRTKTQ